MEYRDERPSLGLVVGEKSSLVVDAGSSKQHAEEFLKKAEKIGVQNFRYLGITHFHWDHVSGIPRLGLVTIGSGKTQKKLEQGLVDIGFENKLRLDLGGVSCVFEHIGGDHSDDSSLVYVEDEKIMFLGDATYRGFYKEKRYHSLEQMERLTEKILLYDCEIYITSHKDFYSREEMETLLGRMIELGKYAEEYSSVEELESKIQIKLSEEDRFYMEAFLEDPSKKGGERAG